jgi:hypothetical protein
MNTPTPEAIEAFIRAEYRLWSEGRYEAILA